MVEPQTKVLSGALSHWQPFTAVRPSEGKGVGERIARLCDAAICNGDDVQTEILPSPNCADLNSERTKRHCLGS
jgi:hypothetical protein